VPAQRVSTSAERIEPAYLREEAAGNESPFRLFAAPPSRLIRSVPHGREVLLEVPSDERPGLEERIVLAALRHGGNAVREPERMSADIQVKTSAQDNVRILLPAESVESFLADLRELGTVPPEGISAWAESPAGFRPTTIVYTVRIRVR
jgi:hypothetical protein